MSEILFEVNNVSYHYSNNREVLKDLNFSIQAGESIALLGANASGKSTLMHLLNGLYFASAGTISAFGTVLTEDAVETPPFSQAFRRDVGFVFQNSDAQLFCSTVKEELAFGPLQLDLATTDLDKRIADTLKLFDIEHLKDRPTHMLSGGEKKKVALASIFICGPRVILMDEPSIGLDPRSQRWLRDFLLMMHDGGVTLVLSSHDLPFIRSVTSRSIILSEEHQIVYDALTETALADEVLLHSVNLI